MNERLPLGSLDAATLAMLGTLLPFAHVASEMASLFGVSVSADTVRRLTEAAGAVQVAIEQQELERIEHDAPPEPAGPPIQQVSADGAMVPLVGGGWTEVRTLAIGALDVGEEVVLRDILARVAAATRFLEGAAEYMTYDPSDLVYRCGRGCLRDPPGSLPYAVIPPFTGPHLPARDDKEDTNDD